MKRRSALLFLLAAFAIPAAVYVASASHEPASWDTAELQGVPYILGISHPTGFPLYVLLGYAWSHAAAIGSVAFRMNAMSGIAMAVVCAAAYAVARQFGASRPVALLAALWFAFTQDVWAHAARAEAQDVAVMCEALSVYAFLRWMKGGSGTWFAAAFALDGLGMAAHPNALWLIPGLIVGAIVAKRRPTVRLAAGAVGLLLAPLLLYLYLPLRSAYVVARGLDPTAGLAGAGGGIFWNYNDPSTLAGFVREITGSEVGTPGYLAASFNPLHLQDALWTFITGLGTQYGAFALVLVFIGAYCAWRRDWRTTLFLCIAGTAALLFLVTYPNESDVGRYRLLCWWIAVPLLGALIPQHRRTPLVVAGEGLLIVFLAIGAGLAFTAQRGFFKHAPAEGGRWVIDAVQPYVPPGSVLISDWLDATSLAYGAYVDRSLPGRIIVSDDKLRAGLYRIWARTHRVFVLVNPSDITSIPGGRDEQRLDTYHELYEMQPLLIP